MSDLYKTLTITHIQEQVPGVKTYTFAPEPGHEIEYQPGQYLTLVFQRMGEEVRRSYSITSSPELGEALTIGVKRIDNGLISRQLIDHAKVGDQVQTIGASGFFVLPTTVDEYRQVFFLAAGSGITPIYALLKTLLHQHTTLHAVLIYSNNNPEVTMFREELLLLQAQFQERFRIQFVYSNSVRLAEAHLYRELLERYLQEFAIAPPEQLLSYVCGPENYMRMCGYGLRDFHIPQENIYRENFVTTKVASHELPPDLEEHQVSLVLQHKRADVSVQYPTTILQAAKQAGLAMPYSCEAGKCGSCVAKCVSGNVWMSYNEVLTDKETARGYILTCVGYPVGGDVVLEI